MGTFPIRFLLTFLITVSPQLTIQQEVNCLWETKHGKIQGSILKSQRQVNFCAFRGVRYAQAPIGKLRFAPPLEKPAWENVLDATADGKMCPQVGDSSLMSEDCLILNVYSKNSLSRVPVSSHSIFSLGPQYLMDCDIVLVTMNYRLGAFGFMSTGTKDAAGNFGYLDQLLALKWVQKHIESFGGNRNQVTLFGESSGGMAVSLHMTSPLSQGLFHRAIAMSGSMTNHHFINNVGWTRKLAEFTSCPMYNPRDLIDCLQNLPWQKIVEVCQTWEHYGFVNLKWYYEIDDYFMPAHPTEIFCKGTFNRVPLIAGITRDEFTFVAYREYKILKKNIYN